MTSLPATVNHLNKSSSTPIIQPHIKASKILGSISLLFVFGYVSLLFKAATNTSLPVEYLYYMNYIGNPLIYYVFNKKFRKDVAEMTCF